MLKMITASTIEVDDPKIAAEDIESQIAPEINLLKNSVGIITCSSEFIETGVLKAVNDILPFETVGMTTLACATNEEEGLDVLSLSVYTADDVDFSVEISSPLSKNNIEKSIKKLYDDSISDLKQKPELAVFFGPLLSDASSEKIIGAFHCYAEDIPVFGSMACSSSFDFDKADVLFNGESYNHSAAVLMMDGNINPRFYISTISEDKITKQKAIITNSDGSVLKEVNNLNLAEYLKTIGLSKGDGIEGSSSIPIVVDYRDGTKPSVRGIYSINDEGHAVCGGDMPMGGTLAIGMLDPEDIVKTAGEAVDAALGKENIHGILMFPCQARNHLLEMDYMAEMEVVNEKIGNKVPYHLAYSGGEICPSYDDKGKSVNRYHNFTFTTCII